MLDHFLALLLRTIFFPQKIGEMSQKIGEISLKKCNELSGTLLEPLETPKKSLKEL